MSTDIAVMNELYDSVDKSRIDRVRQLIQGQRNIDLDKHVSDGMTLLGLACAKGNHDIVNELLSAGASPSKQDFLNQSPMHYAVENDHIDIVKTLLKAGWEDSDKVGISALHIAACKGRTQVAELLIKAKVNVNAQEYKGLSVLECAVCNGHSDIVELLLQAGSRVNIVARINGRTPIFSAVDTGNEGICKMLINNGADLNVTDNYEMSPLCSACIQDNTLIASLLIKPRTKLNMPDRKDNLPIHFTARNGNVKLTELLIKHGSKINVLNSHFESPLHLAVRSGHVDIVQLLVKHGCDVNLCEPYAHVTALHVAVNSFMDDRVDIFTDILNLLIDGGCIIDSRGFSSLESPLYQAVKQRRERIAIALLQHGADPNVDCPFEMSILQTACEKELLGLVDVLLGLGVNWDKEEWIRKDMYSTGINPKMLEGYSHDVPRLLLKNTDLFFRIESMRCVPMSLAECCRMVLRNRLQTLSYNKLSSIGLPVKLQNFVLLKC